MYARWQASLGRRGLPYLLKMFFKKVTLAELKGGGIVKSTLSLGWEPFLTTSGDPDMSVGALAFN